MPDRARGWVCVALANLEPAIPSVCLQRCSLILGEGSLAQGEVRVWFLIDGAQASLYREKLGPW